MDQIRSVLIENVPFEYSQRIYSKHQWHQRNSTEREAIEFDWKVRSAWSNTDSTGGR